MVNCIDLRICFVLQYIIEPNVIVYFDGIRDNKIVCIKNKYMAACYLTRDLALKQQDYIKNKFGLEFQIVEV